MSIFGAMFSGVTGLNAQSQALGMIADNIANVNTIGYKGTTAQFFSLVTQAASRTTFTIGAGLTQPSFSHCTYQGIMLLTPCESMPRTSA